MDTSYKFTDDFEIKCFAISLVCIIHIVLLVLLYFCIPTNTLIPTQNIQKIPVRILPLPPSKTVSPVAVQQPPESSATKPTQSIENSSLQELQENKQATELCTQNLALEQFVDNTETTSTILDSQINPHSNIAKITATPSNQDISTTITTTTATTYLGNTAHETKQSVDTQEDTQPEPEAVTTKNTLQTDGHAQEQASYISYALQTTQTTDSKRQTTQEPEQTSGKRTRHKKRYVNRRLQALAHTPAERELIQACQAALKSVTQQTDTRAQRTPRDYKKLETQAAQAGISIEHMAAVQDQLAHMKYAHYESKVQQILQQTCAIHEINIVVSKPIVQYLDIIITVNKQGTVTRVKFYTQLPLEVEQAITKIIMLCPFPPLPEHFKSSEHTFGFRPFAHLQEGAGHLVYR